MKKRFLAITLALVLCIGLAVPASAADTSGSCGDSVTWSYSGGTLTIQGTGAMAGYRDTQPWYGYRDEIKTVVVGEGVTSLGRRAFWRCGQVTSVTLPGSLTTIGEQAFCQCRELTRVSIPSGVTTIGPSAFSSCSKLADLNIPDSVTSIGDHAFGYCYSLTSIIIPNGVTVIDEWVFSECQGLTSVTIPDSVTSIGEYAFSDCWTLPGINIPDSVTSIGKDAFYHCNKLASVTIPGSITSIEEGTFWSCFDLKSVTIPDSVTAIGKKAFQSCGSLTDVYYGGSESQWKQISIDSSENGNAALLGAAFHYGAGSGTAPDPKPAPLPAFTDVPDWCSDAVNWAVEKAVTDGTSPTTFSPNDDCTHAHILTFLWRAAGEPAAGIKTPIANAKEGSFYYEAAQWASDMGMIDPGTFDPGKPCTRSQAVLYICQAFAAPYQSPVASGFTDVSAGADYAYAVAWAVENGVTNGTGPTTFGPNDTCSRGQIVTFLHRAYVPSARLTVN